MKFFISLLGFYLIFISKCSYAKVIKSYKLHESYTHNRKKLKDISTFFWLGGGSNYKVWNLREDNTQHRNINYHNLELDNFSDGLLFFHRKSINGGLGLAMPHESISMPNQNGLTSSLGVSFDHYVEYLSYIDHLKDIKEVKKSKKIPHNSKMLKNWRNGDSVYFHKIGGIILSSRFISWPVFFGPHISVSGGWQYYIEKLDEDNIFINVMNISIDSLGIGHVDFISEVSTEIKTEVSKGFSFVVNITNDAGREMYKNLLSGNIVAAQREVSIDRAYIVKTEDVFIEKKSLRKSLYFGIPYANIQRGKNVEIVTREMFDYLSLKNKNLISASMYYYDLKEFGRFNKYNESRVTNSYNVKLDDSKDLKEQEKQAVFSNSLLSWTFESTKSTISKINKYSDKLFQGSLLDEYVGMKFSTNHQNDLGYVQLQLGININKKIHDIITGKLGNYVLADIEATAYKKMIENSRDNVEEFLDSCDHDSIYKNVSSCKKFYKRKIKRQIKKLRRKFYFNARKPTKNTFQQKYINNIFFQLNSNIIKNRYLLSSFIELFGQCGIQLKFSLSGERISRVDKEVVLPHNDACYRRSFQGETRVVGESVE